MKKLILVIPIAIVIVFANLFIVPIERSNNFLTPYGPIHMDVYKVCFNNSTSVMIIIYDNNGVSFYYNGIYGKTKNKYILAYVNFFNRSFIITKCPFIRLRKCNPFYILLESFPC